MSFGKKKNSLQKHRASCEIRIEYIRSIIWCFNSENAFLDRHTDAAGGS